MRILIADDHELFLKGLEFILSENIENLEIDSAQSYTDIFNLLDKSEQYDLIITDLAMPGANWLMAINKIHQTLPDTPIIIISAVFARPFASPETSSICPEITCILSFAC